MAIQVIEDGLISNSDYCPSPNCDDRSPNTEISLLVIHNISLPPADFSSNAVVEFFCNKLDHSEHPYFEGIKSLKVSAHLFIRRSGKIIQFVPFHRRAWHAGESNFEGRTRCNDFSIGIELEGTDNIAYTIKQYQQLVEVTRCLMQYYPGITPQRIVGHSDIAPDRKTDPGPAFDWVHYRGLLTRE
jgi:N-acetyl-anhydromuramoyl-L-alanine amidase